MGQVFLAEDTRLKRNVALKFLTIELARDEEFRERFMREARSAAQFNHKNIVTIYDVGEDHDQTYLAMEYVEGRSLREMIDTRALNYEQGLDIFGQFCTGLKTAHDAGIVHRDLKPANIMVTGSFEAKILDFGLAKGMTDDNITQAGTAMGTVNYMSPEQAQGIDTDARSDIFAAGIILFELLTGVNPFVRGYTASTVHAVVYEPAGMLSTYNPDLPGECQILVDKALAKEHADRYQKIDELLSDLARLRSGEAIATRAVDQPAVPRSDRPSLAVLFLENLGPEEDDYLSHGITEDLIIDLSRVGSLRVLPMRKIKKYKSSDLDIEELAQILQVNMILDGSIHRSGESVRVSAQLIDVTNDEALWSDRWEQSTDSLPQIKTALARGISTALGIDSSVLIKANVGKVDANNSEAYDQYLKGKYALENRKSKEDVQTAQDYFNEALKLEPSLLLARVGLAEIHKINNQVEEAKELLAPALREARERGLRTDEATVLTILGETLSKSSEYTKAIDALREAIAIYCDLGDANGEARALASLGSCLIDLGQLDEVVGNLAERFRELEGSGMENLWVATSKNVVGMAHSRAGNRERSIELNQNALQIARANGLDHLTARIMQRLATEYALSNSETALAYAEESRYIAERLNDPTLRQSAAFSTFTIELQSGAFARALSRVEHLIASYRESNSVINVANMEANKGLILQYMGLYQEAINQVPKIRAAIAAIPAEARKFRELLADVIVAKSSFMMGEHENSLQALRTIRAGFQSIKMQHLLMVHCAELGQFLYLAGEKDEARQVLDDALELTKNNQDGYSVALIHGFRALLQLGSGEITEIPVSLRRNVEQYNGIGAEIPARRLLGQALLEHGATKQERDEGHQFLLQGIGLAKDRGFGWEVDLMKAVLERNDSP